MEDWILRQKIIPTEIILIHKSNPNSFKCKYEQKKLTYQRPPSWKENWHEYLQDDRQKEIRQRIIDHLIIFSGMRTFSTLSPTKKGENSKCVGRKRVIYESFKIHFKAKTFSRILRLGWLKYIFRNRQNSSSQFSFDIFHARITRFYLQVEEEKKKERKLLKLKTLRSKKEKNIMYLPHIRRRMSRYVWYARYRVTLRYYCALNFSAMTLL